MPRMRSIFQFLEANFSLQATINVISFDQHQVSDTWPYEGRLSLLLRLSLPNTKSSFLQNLECISVIQGFITLTFIRKSMFLINIFVS